MNEVLTSESGNEGRLCKTPVIETYELYAYESYPRQIMNRILAMFACG